MLERVLLFETINILSYLLIGPFVLGRGVDIVTVRDGGRKDYALYVIGGMCCRTEKPFSFLIDRLNLKVPKDVPVYLVEYKNQGLSPWRARRTIRAHRKANGNKRASFLAVSMGYQLTAGVAKSNDRLIAVNPCVGLLTLKPPLAIATFFLLPVVRLLALLLGWLLLLPVVKVDGPAYSIQLLLDQLSACGSLSILGYQFAPDVLFMGEKDNLIDNRRLLKMPWVTKKVRDGARPIFGTIRKIAETAEMPEYITKAIPKLVEVAKEVSIEWINSGHFGVDGNEEEYLRVAADRLFRRRQLVGNGST